jgi:nitroimidazol reductase NimA-like FMN-containing flavoprotein (pyridoxamine 5'-phosphate oxidase superfamily)
MTNQPDPTILELDEHQCWDLLRSQEVGRLAVAIANHPDIFPINYVVDHATVVFRTAEGTKLAAAVLGESVAFEIDGEADGEAWSVVIKGAAVEIERMYELFDAVELPLYPWHVAPKHRFVRILPEMVTGRRFRVADRVSAHTDDPPHRRAGPD